MDDRDYSTPKKKSFLWIAYSFIALFVLCVVFLAFAPTFLSTESGTKLFSKILEKKVDGKVSIKELSLSWLGSQKATKIVVDWDKVQYFECASLDLKQSLWDIVFSSKPWKELKLEKLKLNLEESQKKRGLMFVPAPCEHLVLDDATITLKNGNVTHYSLIDFNLEAKFSNTENGLVVASAKTQNYYSLGKFDIEVELQGERILDKISSSLLDSSIFNEINYKYKIKSSKIPVGFFDDMLGAKYPRYSELFQSLLGQVANINGEGFLGKSTLDLNLNIFSSNMRAKLSSKTTDEAVTFGVGNSFSFSINDYLFGILAEKLNLKNISIQSAAICSVKLNSLKLPKVETFLDITNLSFDANCSVSNLDLYLPSHDENFLMEELSLTSSSSNVWESIAFDTSTKLIYKDKAPSTVDATFKINNIQTVFSHPTHRLLTDLSLNVSKFPSLLFEKLALDSSTFSETVGDTFSVTASSEEHASQTDVSFSFSSPYLEIPTLDFGISESVFLKSPGKFRYFTQKKNFPTN